MRKKYIRMMLAGGIIVLFGLLAIFLVPSDKQVPTAPVKSVTSKQNMDADAYPLYPGLIWGSETAESETLPGNVEVVGFKADAENATSTSDIASSTLPFEAYYDSKLKALGWGEVAAYDADGAGSSSRTYVKGDDYLTLSYASEAVNQISNQPLSCPCRLTFTVFSGKKTQ